MGELRSGLWAVMFTDLVDSTSLLARVGESVGSAIRQEHDSIASRAVQRHNGVLVKSTGDGAMAAFASVVDAIDAAVELQQGIHHRNRGAAEPIAIRVGLSVGEVEHDAGDLFGLTVNEAARVCGVADGDQILVTDVARSLAGSRLEHPLIDPTAHELKGLPQSVTVYEVRWTPTEVGAESRLPRVLGSEMGAFAGRDDELRTVLELWGEVQAGAKRVVLVAGEPGIGKTRLAAQVAIRTHRDGARVLLGTCDDGAVVPFQPFAEALVAHLDADPFAPLGPAADELARLAPTVLGGSELVDPRSDDADQHRLFEAVVSWLGDLSASGPVVLVLDDLHWATQPTLLMLRHVISSPRLAGLLVVATYRDTDLDRTHPLSAMLPELRKRPETVRVLLRGLSEPSLEELIHELGYESADGSSVGLAHVLHTETEGNPFFVAEVLRHLGESDAFVERDGRLVATRASDDLGIPEGVREVLGQRLGRLGEDADTLLRCAAVIGREFPTELVLAVSGVDEDAALDVIDRALAARLLSDAGRGRLRFSHALVRSALLDEISTSRRQRLHRDVADALTAAGSTDAGAIAYHLCEAGTAADPTRVIRAAIAASRLHATGTTYDLALRELDRAMDSIGDRRLDAEAHVDYLLARGDVHMLAGDVAAARDAYYEATNTTGATTDQIVRAALAFHGPSRVTTEDEREIPLYRYALTLVDAGTHPATASRLHANLAQGLVTRDDERSRHVRRAVELAERTDDVLAHHDAQRARFWSSIGLGDVNTAAAESALALARQLGSSSLVLDNLLVACIAHGQRGDSDAFAERLAEYSELAVDAQSPLRVAFIHLVDSRLALARGQLEESERAVNRSIEVSDDEAILLGWAAISTQLRLYQRRSGEQAAEMAAWLAGGIIPDAARLLAEAGIVVNLAADGQLVDASRLFEELALGEFERLTAPGEWLRIAELATLAHACWLVRATDASLWLIDGLAPYASQHLQITLAVDLGPATLALGRLHLLRGDYDEAIVAFTDAIERSERADQALRAAESRIGCAEARWSRDRPGDREAAQRLLTEVDEFTAAFDVPLVVAEVQRVRAAQQPTRRHG